MTTTGLIANPRRGKRTQHHYQYLLDIKGVDDRSKAEKFLGKSVTWKSTADKLIKGSITRVHGDNGRVVARFERGLPGQALGGKALIN